jgi:hypothetical protein
LYAALLANSSGGEVKTGVSKRQLSRSRRGARTRTTLCTSGVTPAQNVGLASSAAGLDACSEFWGIGLDACSDSDGVWHTATACARHVAGHVGARAATAAGHPPRGRDASRQGGRSETIPPRQEPLGALARAHRPVRARRHDDRSGRGAGASTPRRGRERACARAARAPSLRAQPARPLSGRPPSRTGRSGGCTTS